MRPLRPSVAMIRLCYQHAIGYESKSGCVPTSLITVRARCSLTQTAELTPERGVSGTSKATVASCGRSCAGAPCRSSPLAPLRSAPPAPRARWRVGGDARHATGLCAGITRIRALFQTPPRRPFPPRWSTRSSGAYAPSTRYACSFHAAHLRRRRRRHNHRVFVRPSPPNGAHSWAPRALPVAQLERRAPLTIS